MTGGRIRGGGLVAGPVAAGEQVARGSRRWRTAGGAGCGTIDDDDEEGRFRGRAQGRRTWGCCPEPRCLGELLDAWRHVPCARGTAAGRNAAACCSATRRSWSGSAGHGVGGCRRSGPAVTRKQNPGRILEGRGGPGAYTYDVSAAGRGRQHQLVEEVLCTGTGSAIRSGARQLGRWTTRSSLNSGLFGRRTPPDSIMTLRRCSGTFEPDRKPPGANTCACRRAVRPATETPKPRHRWKRIDERRFGGGRRVRPELLQGVGRDDPAASCCRGSAVMTQWRAGRIVIRGDARGRCPPQESNLESNPGRTGPGPGRTGPRPDGGGESEEVARDRCRLNTGGRGVQCPPVGRHRWRGRRRGAGATALNERDGRIVGDPSGWGPSARGSPLPTSSRCSSRCRPC